MPRSSPSDRGGGWVLAQSVLIVLMVVLVFLPPYWPRELAYLGIPLAVVGALGFAIDLQLSPRMVFFRYDDVPGVIGRVGTMFGEAGVNIANMAVSRTREGGKALMALAVDSEPPPELVERIRGEGFDDARIIQLG